MKRPTNHATQSPPVATTQGDLPPTPEVPEDLLLWLEHVYPPRCYQPDRETLEEHIDYAGRVGLVQFLRDAHDNWQPDEQEPDDPFDTEDNTDVLY